MEPGDREAEGCGDRGDGSQAPGAISHHNCHFLSSLLVSLSLPPSLRLIFSRGFFVYRPSGPVRQCRWQKTALSQLWCIHISPSSHINRNRLAASDLQFLIPRRIFVGKLRSGMCSEVSRMHWSR